MPISESPAPPRPAAGAVSVLPERILLVFVDGLGVPPGALEDSVYGPCPTLRALLRDSSGRLDATLGVPGMPQSATGQTALFTGVNAAQRVGAHVEGFPNAHLRACLERENLFLKLHRAGRTCTFANAYATMPGAQLPMAFRSVTTVCALAAFGRTRDRDSLLAGRAVYHDLTRETLPSRGIEGVPVIAEEEAARHLLSVFRSVDFCLFEYFRTDHVGHRGTIPEIQRVLASLDRFLGAVAAGLDKRSELLLLTSDHGNIEAPQLRGHTANVVPWVCLGRGVARARNGCRSILDVTPKILELLGGAPAAVPGNVRSAEEPENSSG